MQCAFHAPLAARPAFVHPFLHFLRLYYFTPLRCVLFIRRKLCNSSHVIVRAAVVRDTQQGNFNCFLSFLFRFHLLAFLP